MKKFSHLLIGLVVAAIPLSSAQAENINIYGWQNWSYEFVSADGGSGEDRDVDRLSNNAANIGFMSHMDTGIPGLQVGFRCEQFTYWGRLNEYTGWCNRNSKISLRHERAGELMFGQWLLPHNEIVAQWIDPFYDAGADSHTSIMGNIGAHGGLGISGLSALFYNGSFEHDTDFGSDYGSMAFNRRQEGVVQYVWPNTSDMASQTREGFQFRAAITEGSETDAPRGGDNVDPRIFSTGASYQMNTANGGQLWFAATYEQHEDISATDLDAAEVADVLDTRGNVVRAGAAAGWNETCGDSDDDSYRLAARYTHNWGNGQSSMIGAMWETLEYEISECVNNMGTPETTDDVATAPNGQTSIGIERDAWMFSGKHIFGNGFDFRFSYMNADELECDTGTCDSAYEDDSGADAYNLGLFYTMPAGTELRATFSEVQNDDTALYNFGINGASGATQGEDISMLAVGIVHWFD